MPDDPVEFRAAKPGLAVADWLRVRFRRDAAVCAGAAALLTACGAAATLGLFLFLWGTFSCGLGWQLALIPTIGITAGLFLLQRRYDSEPAELFEIDAGTRGRVKLRLSRLTGNSWLLFLDRPVGESNAFMRFCANVGLLAPRLFAVGRRMWKRSRRLKALDVPSVAAGLDGLMQSGRRVSIGEFVQDFPDKDPQRLIEDLTSLDGVVLLASDPPGLTLAPSLVEEFEDWKREARRKRRSPGY